MVNKILPSEGERLVPSSGVPTTAAILHHQDGRERPPVVAVVQHPARKQRISPAKCHPRLDPGERHTLRLRHAVTLTGISFPGGLPCESF